MSEQLTQFTLQLEGLTITIQRTSTAAAAAAPARHDLPAGPPVQPTRSATSAAAADPLRPGPAGSQAQGDTDPSVANWRALSDIELFRLWHRYGRGIAHHELRIARAARAGYSARDVLEGRASRVLPSVEIPERSILYIVLRVGNSCDTGPICCVSRRALHDLVGSQAPAGSVFHGFASRTEAEVYTRAAGYQWPIQEQA
jgi:hypothetical protein